MHFSQEHAGSPASQEHMLACNKHPHKLSDLLQWPLHQDADTLAAGARADWLSGVTNPQGLSIE